MIKTNRFEGNAVLITGSATGLGEACALRFAREGADIICVDINEDEISVYNDGSWIPVHRRQKLSVHMD